MAPCKVYPDTLEISTHFVNLFSILRDCPFNPLYTYFRCRRIRKACCISIFSLCMLLPLRKLMVFTLWGEDHWHLPKDARGTVNPGSLWHQDRQLKDACNSALSLVQGHHKQCSSEPYSAVRCVFIGSLCNSNWLGGACHRVWPRVEDMPSAHPTLFFIRRFSSVSFSLPTMPWS